MSPLCKQELGAEPRLLLLWFVVLVGIAIAALAGCGFSGSATAVQAPVALRGTVRGGDHPVSGAALQLYATGLSGAASAAQPLLSEPVQSDSSGNFVVPDSYHCPSPSSQVYLVARGGNPGLASGSSNPALALMAMLGSCSSLSPSSSIVVNEATTVGSVWPLAAYLASPTDLGSAAGDSTFTAAAASVGQFVSIQTGSSPGVSTPESYFAQNSKLYSLADVFDACVNSAGGTAGDGSPCGSLFSTATPSGRSAPTDTLSAAMRIAQNPDDEVAAIFGLAASSSAFQPTLTAAPPDWTLTLSHPVATPSISPGPGTYSTAQEVTISDTTAGSSIHYTTDGTVPTGSSPLYSGAFSIAETSTVQAIAVLGPSLSSVASTTITITETPTPASQLVFLNPPTNAPTGTVISPAITVAVKDSRGNIEASATNLVRVNLTGVYGLGGTLEVKAKKGLATFSNLSVGTAGEYTLTASSPGLNSATSTKFTISPLVSVTLDPVSVTLAAAQAQAFHASVSGASNSGVTWSLAPVLGSISSAGLYTAPVRISGTQTVTVSATSIADRTETASAKISLVDPGLTISPSGVNFGAVAVNSTATENITFRSTGTSPVTIYAAVLTGKGFMMSEANFPMTLNPGETTALSLYFEPTVAGVASGQLTVTDSFVGNATSIIPLTGTTAVAPPVAITISPANTSIHVGSSQQFAAAITGTSNSAVRWTVSGIGCSGAACGVISTSGLYTAPALAPVPTAVTVTGTSEADTTKSAISVVTIETISSATYYLAPAADGGNDSNNGTSPSTPWLSPKHPLNCGDTIVANPGSYSNTNFSASRWGAVTCPSGNNVAWLKCATFDTCKISSSGGSAMNITADYWGVQGWEVTSAGSGTQIAACLTVAPGSSSANVHHVVLANNVLNGCWTAGVSSYDNGLAGVDYLAVVGNIVYNAAQSGLYCFSGISLSGIVATDTSPGTHVYLSGNFSYDNVEPSTCNGGIPTDGEGIIFDTWSGYQTAIAGPYSQQAVIQNNLLFRNGGRGITIFRNSNAPVIIKNNTIYGNNTQTIQASNPSCSDLYINITRMTQATGNIVATNKATGCGANPLYAMAVAMGDSTDSLDSNFAYGLSGQNTTVSSSGSFTFGPNNALGTSPAFSGPADPGPPSCGSYASVTACMASVIANYAPTLAAAKGFGFHPPSAVSIYDPLFPQWLCNVNLPPALVTLGCQPAP